MIEEQGPADAGLMVQDVVYTGLEAMRAAVPLDLCAYLHATEDQGPQLFLGAPDLASIDPTDAFSLFTALRDALQDPHEGDETMLLGGYLAIAVSTEGPVSRGLHVVGRHETPFEPEERAIIARLAGALGRLIHSVEQPQAAPQPRPTAGAPIRVAVEMLSDRARGTDRSACRRARRDRRGRRELEAPRHRGRRHRRRARRSRSADGWLRTTCIGCNVDRSNIV
jgi:hypothetical protein